VDTNKEHTLLLVLLWVSSVKELAKSFWVYIFYLDERISVLSDNLAKPYVCVCMVSKPEGMVHTFILK